MNSIEQESPEPGLNKEELKTLELARDMIKSGLYWLTRADQEEVGSEVIAEHTKLLIAGFNSSPDVEWVVRFYDSLNEPDRKKKYQLHHSPTHIVEVGEREMVLVNVQEHSPLAGGVTISAREVGGGSVISHIPLTMIPSEIENIFPTNSERATKEVQH